jgi:2-methylaconitate cis-trans-isomerase PrpF
MFPTGNVVDTLEVPGVGSFKATMINAGIPTIFLNADEIGYTGTELQEAINGDPPRWPLRDHPRPWRDPHGAHQQGGRSRDPPAHPKVAFVAPPKQYVSSSGKPSPCRIPMSWCVPCPWASCTTP